MKKIIHILLMMLIVISIGSVAAQETYAATTHNITSGLNNDQIQAIIDNAASGDTINFLGSYYEGISLIINKTLNLVSEVGTQLSSNSDFSNIPEGIKNEFGNLASAIYFTEGSAGSSLAGFKINNTNNANCSSIALKNVENISIKDNNLTGYYGIYGSEISNTLIENNNIENSYDGIYLWFVSGIDLISNNITNCERNGISSAHTSEDVTILYNILKNCTEGMYVGDIKGLEVINNTIINSSKEGILIHGVVDGIIKDNKFLDSTYGILFRANFKNIAVYNNTFINTTPLGFDNSKPISRQGTFSSIPDETPIINTANISVSSKVSTSTIQNGGAITYTIKVTNLGKGAANSIKINEILPKGVSVSSVSASRGSYSNGEWNIGTLGADGDAVLIINAKATTSGSYSTNNKATYKDDTGSTVKNAISSKTSLKINPYVKLTYAASATPKVKAKKYAMINVKVKNSGLDKSGSVSVYYKLPKTLKKVSVSRSSEFKSNKWTAKVSAGKTNTYTMKVKVTKKGTHKVPVYVNGKLYKKVSIKGT